MQRLVTGAAYDLALYVDGRTMLLEHRTKEPATSPHFTLQEYREFRYDQTHRPGPSFVLPPLLATAYG